MPETLWNTAARTTRFARLTIEDLALLDIHAIVATRKVELERLLVPYQTKVTRAVLEQPVP